MPEDVRRKLEGAGRVPDGHAHPQLVILLGADADGRQREDSDIGLLVMAETKQ